MIAPDLRGFGDSGLAPDGFYDLAAHARDLHALVHEHYGHARCAAVGGDLGGGVIQDLSLRFPGFVARQVLFNTVLPALGDRYARGRHARHADREVRATADYYRRQGREADALAAELDTPEKRERYVGEFYGHRLWATPGAFSREDVAFMAAPFRDPASTCARALATTRAPPAARPLSEAPCWFEVSEVPTVALYGPDDHVIPREFPADVRGRVRRARRPVRRPAVRALPAVGARRAAQPDGRRVPRGPARR